jgi:hypothetical protein
MKKLLVALVLMLGACTPVKYVMVDSHDSTKLVEVRKRVIDDDSYLHTPIYFNYWSTPYYRPIIIHQAPIRIPQYRGGRGRH